MTRNIAQAPIIIIGMHRSGTTMIASMLRELGLFIGNDLEDNSESMFFIKHNNWIFRQCGGYWDNPDAIQWLFKDKDILRLTEEYTRARVRGLPAQPYLGWKRFLAGHNPLTGMGQEAWGWKDPRTTYSLPLWLRIYPDARVIHIYRHGVPVAASLRARERRNLRIAEAYHKRRMIWRIYDLVPKSSGFIWSNRCLSLAGGFSLWESYVETAMQAMEKVGVNGLTIKYEEFLDDPSTKLLELSQFCGLKVSEERVKEIARQVKPERGNAHANDEELVRFYEEVKDNPIMTKLGYA